MNAIDSDDDKQALKEIHAWKNPDLGWFGQAMKVVNRPLDKAGDVVLGTPGGRRCDFNATTHGQRDLDDDRLSNLIESVSTKRLGLDDVEAGIIGKGYEYLIRKFAEGGGQSAGEWSGATWTTRQGCPEGERGGVHQFYTPPEVGTIMSRVLQPEPGSEPDGHLEIDAPTCGSGGLLVKCEPRLQALHPVRESSAHICG